MVRTRPKEDRDKPPTQEKNGEKDNKVIHRKVGQFGKKYSNQTMINAVDAVKNGMHHTEASSKFGIPNSTLRDVLSGKSRFLHKFNLNSKTKVLTFEEEAELLRWASNSLHYHGLRPTEIDVLNSIQNLLQSNKVDDVIKKSHEYFTELARDYPILPIRRDPHEKLGPTETGFRKWFQDVNSRFAKIDALDIFKDISRVFSTDTRLVQYCETTCKLLGPSNAENSNSEDSSCSNFTFQLTYSASGSFVSPMIVYPPWLEGSLTSSGKDIYSIKSDNGTMEVETFYTFIEQVFDPWLVLNSIKKPVLLIADGATTPITMQLSEMCENLGIVLYFFPLGSKVKLQPLELESFKPFDSYWAEAVFRFHKINPYRPVRCGDFCLLLEKILAVIPSESIIDRFRSTGLFQFNNTHESSDPLKDRNNENNQTTIKSTVDEDASRYTSDEDITSTAICSNAEDISNTRCTIDTKFTNEEYLLARNVLESIMGSKLVQACQSKSNEVSEDLSRVYLELLRKTSEIDKVTESKSSNVKKTKFNSAKVSNKGKVSKAKCKFTNGEVVKTVRKSKKSSTSHSQIRFVVESTKSSTRKCQIRPVVESSKSSTSNGKIRPVVESRESSNNGQIHPKIESTESSTSDSQIHSIFDDSQKRFGGIFVSSDFRSGPKDDDDDYMSFISIKEEESEFLDSPISKPVNTDQKSCLDSFETSNIDMINFDKYPEDDSSMDMNQATNIEPNNIVETIPESSLEFPSKNVKEPIDEAAEAVNETEDEFIKTLSENESEVKNFLTVSTGISRNSQADLNSVHDSRKEVEHCLVDGDRKDFTTTVFKPPDESILKLRQNSIQRI